MQRGLNIADVLKAQLKARGWTQKQLAEKTGIAREDINAICNGKRVGDERLRRIAQALKMPPEDLRRAALREGSDAPASDIDRLLAELEASGTEAMPVVVTALQLLARRLELVEKQQARSVPRASGSR